MPIRRFLPTRFAAAVIKGVLAAIIILILFRGVWLGMFSSATLTPN